MKLTLIVFGLILTVAISLSIFFPKPKEDQVLGLISPEVVVTPPSATPTASTSAELRFSAKDAVETAAFVLSKGKGKIWPNCLP